MSKDMAIRFIFEFGINIYIYFWPFLALELQKIKLFLNAITQCLAICPPCAQHASKGDLQYLRLFIFCNFTAPLTAGIKSKDIFEILCWKMSKTCITVDNSTKI